MLACLVLVGPAAWAQPAGTTDANAGSDPSVSERVKREADRVMHWIKLNAEGARKSREDRSDTARRPVAREAAATAPVAVSPAVRPAVAPQIAQQGVASQGAAPAKPQSSDAAQSAGGLPAPAAARLEAPLASPGTPDPASADATSAPEHQTAMRSPAVPSGEPVAASAPADELVIVRSVEPEFSHATMSALRKANAEVAFDVQPDGSVANVRIVRTTSARIVTPVLAAVSQWQFKPIREPRSASVEVGFNLD